MTPDQLQQIIDKMTTGPWYNSQSYMWNSRSEVVCESDTIEPEDRDGIVALRNHASALVECAKACTALRDSYVRGDSSSHYEAWNAMNAAIKRLEEIK